MCEARTACVRAPSCPPPWTHTRLCAPTSGVPPPSTPPPILLLPTTSQHVTCSCIASGVLGPLQELEASFQVPVEDRSNFRWQPGRGDGALMDLGCYPLHWVRTVTGEEPEILEAHAEADTGGTDAAMSATCAKDAAMCAKDAAMSN